MNKPLENQTALVSGASSGIGHAIALAFAEAGANVVINFHSHQQEAEALAADIEAISGKAIVVSADISEQSQVDDLFNHAQQHFQGIDIVVAIAGIQRDAAFVDMTLEEWNKVINVNLTGQFLVAQRAVRHFTAQGRRDISKALGKIICISSVHEIIPWAGHVNYATSKGGIQMMMKSLAQEVAPLGIRVNSIAPGAIRTPINKDAWDTPEKLNELLTLIPYGRIGEGADIGKAAVWLASDDSDYVVGTTLFVDGGMTLYPGFSDNG